MAPRPPRLSEVEVPPIDFKIQRLQRQKGGEQHWENTILPAIMPIMCILTILVQAINIFCLANGRMWPGVILHLASCGFLYLVSCLCSGPWAAEPLGPSRMAKWEMARQGDGRIQDNELEEIIIEK